MLKAKNQALKFKSQAKDTLVQETPSSKGGRKSGFTPGLLVGRGLGLQIEMALYGDIAGTPGGQLALRYVNALGLRNRRLHARKNKQVDFAHFEEQLEFTNAEKTMEAVGKGDARLFRDFAACLDARLEVLDKGPKDPIHYWAGRFIEFCELDACRHSYKEAFPQFPDSRTLKAASLKGPHRPKEPEILKFLGEVIKGKDGEEPVDIKTVERIAERFGSRRPPKGSDRLKDYREFWEW